jgi:hypothetical protein
MPWIDQLTEEQKASLPQELLGNETLNRFDSLGDLAKGFVETKSLVGQSIRIPPKEAGEAARQEFLNKLIHNAPDVMLKPHFEEPEQSEEFYRTLGKPEAPDKYQNPEGTQLAPEVEAELRSVLHKANLTNAQYQKAIAEFAAMHKTVQDNLTTQQQSQLDALQGKWGMTAQERFAAAEKANAEFFPGREFKQLTAAEIEGLFNISKSLLGKGAQVATQPGGASEKLPPDEAQRRAAEILNNPAYWDKSNPEQPYLIEKRLKYLEMAGYQRTLEPFRAEGKIGF